MIKVLEKKISGTLFKLIIADITKQSTQAIVNAANSSLMGGGGVDGAIHSAGGPEILKECKIIRKKQGKLPAGNSVLTTAGKLQSDYVIHTVGPIWRGGNNNEDEILANSYINSLRLASKNNIKSLSFPSISTGAYRFPKERAAMIALQSILSYIEIDDIIKEVIMVLYSEKDYNIYYTAWEDMYNN